MWFESKSTWWKQCFGFVLSVRPIELSEGLELKIERKMGQRGLTVFDLSNLVNGDAIF